MGDAIRAARVERDLTQGQLADRIGVSWRTVSNWERGVHIPDARHMKLITDALGEIFTPAPAQTTSVTTDSDGTTVVLAFDRDVFAKMTPAEQDAAIASARAEILRAVVESERRSNG